jgi:histidinol-phosphate/aromatic aminotransferase/cobyric acid decarboxylase-like protein
MTAAFLPYPVDLSLLDGTAHTPSVLSLQRSMGGDGRRLADFCIPVNPYFPPPELMEKLRAELPTVLKFYPGSATGITESLARLAGVEPRFLVAGNGSTELITWIDQLLIWESVVTEVPTFGRWTDQPRETGKQVHPFLLRPDNGYRIDPDEFADFALAAGARSAVISNPNNPTGSILSRGEVIRLMDRLASLDLLVVDESFIDFSYAGEVPSVVREAVERPNVVVLKSLGKNFGLHGVRFGFAAANARLAATLRRALPHWNLNGLAELIISEIPRHLAAYEASRARVVADRSYAEERLGELEGFKVHPSRANFTYVRVPDWVEGVQLRNGLLRGHGLLTRECGSKLGSDSRHFRFATRPAAETDRLVGALALLGQRPQRFREERDLAGALA